MTWGRLEMRLFIENTPRYDLQAFLMQMNCSICQDGLSGDCIIRQASRLSAKVSAQPALNLVGFYHHSTQS